MSGLRRERQTMPLARHVSHWELHNKTHDEYIQKQSREATGWSLTHVRLVSEK